MTTATATQITPKVGDIFVASWGYDQTNIDFYTVVRVSKSSVWIQESGQVITEQTGFMSENVVPSGSPRTWRERDWETGEVTETVAPVTMHRVKYSGDGYPYLRMNSYKYASLWNGKPRSQTHYA